MSKKLGIYTLTDESIKLMKDLVKKTKDEQKEHGFDLCTDMKNVLVPRNVCSGSSCDILRDRQCTEKEFLVGGFHTHVRTPEPSLSDLVVAIDYGMECIGTGKYNKINCYTVKDNLKEEDRTRIITDSLKILKKKKIYFEDAVKIRDLENEIKSKYVNEISIK